MESTTEARIDKNQLELITIAENEFKDGSFFGFFETDEIYMVRAYGSVEQLAEALFKAADNDSDIKTAIVLAAKHILTI